MKILAVLAVLAGCCAHPPSNAPRIQAAANVWKIAGPGVSGSGLPIVAPVGEVWFLTAAHVFDAGPGPWTASNRAGEKLEAGYLVSRHPTEDAVILGFASDYPAQAHDIDFEALEFGEKVYGAGWGGGYGLWLTDGLVSAARRTTTPIFGGDSGGGLFDEEGALLGMIVGRGDIHAAHHAFVIPMAELRDWLEPQL